MDMIHDSITRRYMAPHGKELIIYFLPESPVPAAPQSCHLSLVVNKPSRTRPRGLHAF